MNYFKFSFNVIISTILVVIFVYALFIKRLVDHFRNKQSEKFIDVDFEKEFGAKLENNNSTLTHEKVEESDYARKLSELSDEDLIKFLEEDEKKMEELKVIGKQLDKTNRILTWINENFFWIAFPAIILYLFFVIRNLGG